MDRDPCRTEIVLISGTCATCFVAATRPRGASGGGRRSPLRLYASTNAGGAFCIATARNPSPSQRKRFPNLASQIRAAFSSIASNTGCSSPSELDMTRSTSEVAVCWSSASARFFCVSASSRVRWSSCFWRLTAEEARRRAAIGSLQRLSFVVLRRRVFMRYSAHRSRTGLARGCISRGAQDHAGVAKGITLAPT